MFNTFKPVFSIHKRTSNTHDWFYIGLRLCNEFSFSMTILGYGFKIGVWIYDVMKED